MPSIGAFTLRGSRKTFENFMVKIELTMIAGRLCLKYGRIMALASAALLIAKNLAPSQEPVASTCEQLDQELGRNLTGT